MNKKVIIPRKLQGFWELMPKDQQHFSNMLNKLETVFKQNCFVSLDTPVLEYSETLLAKSGGDTDKEVYRFSKGSTDMCMRYDLTVPLARFVSMHKEDLNFPFKRYQIGKVYRGERPQKGRFREFYQCDADIIGDETLSIVADAECVNLFEQCFNALDLDVEINVSNRKILNGYIESINMQEKCTEILIVLDKLAKLPKEEISTQLFNIGLDENQCQSLIKLANTCGTMQEILEDLQTFCDYPLFQTGLEELCQLDKNLKLLGSKNIVYNLSIIRGHNYYTGTVFEGFLSNAKDLGAVGGGGRFENLCGYFSDKTMPGVGMSVGITRLFDILSKQLQYFDNCTINEIDCAIITFDDTFDEGLALMAKLRNQKIKAELFYENKTFKSKMKETNRRQIKFAVIVGADELKSNLFTLKDMTTSQQQTVSFQQLINQIKSSKDL